MPRGREANERREKLGVLQKNRYLYKKEILAINKGRVLHVIVLLYERYVA